MTANHWNQMKCKHLTGQRGKTIAKISEKISVYFKFSLSFLSMLLFYNIYFLPDLILKQPQMDQIYWGDKKSP